MSIRAKIVALATLAFTCMVGASSALASTFVVYGPGVDATTAAAMAQEELGQADVRVAGPIQDWIGVADNVPVPVGATEVRRCDEDRRKRPLKGYLIGIENSMADMSYRDALRDIETVVDKLPCLAEKATADDIYTLFFLQGVASFFEDDRDGARESFARAAATAPGREWPVDWPPTPQPVYLEALRQVTANPPAALVVEIDGKVIHNGTLADASPRLLAGGHMLWMPATETGMWITVPPRPDLPENGVLLTSAGRLREGLLAGDARYAPWLQTVADKEGWDDIVLVSPDGAVRYQNGEFTALGATGKRLAAKARRKARESKKLGALPIAGLVVVGVGAGTTAAGLGLNLSSFRSGLPQVGDILPPRPEYEAKVQQNKAGLGMAIAGGATVATGAIITIIGASIPGGGVAALPWFSADADGVAFGISGRLP
jgi:hypothetical protein